MHPRFSVVLATFNRGRHIAPTVESAMDQTFSDFELLVIGDGVTDDTLLHVVRKDPRVSIINLPVNSGSQSGPNNAGIARARGTYVAYLGHDDIWMPDHLEALATVFDATESDVAVSGCVYHGPPGSEFHLVSGIFSDEDTPRQSFFPPTSLAHRAGLSVEIGGWRMPRNISAPVDADFLLRAVAAGKRFASTGKITAHKFAAGHRYLSYLNPSSSEQTEMLSRIRANLMNAQACGDLEEKARADGTFMRSQYPDYGSIPPGQIFRENQVNKGLRQVTSQLLRKTVYVPQTMEPRGLDWYPAEQKSDGTLFRWSGPNPRPKVLIPFHGDTQARICLHLSPHDPGHLIGKIQLVLNGTPITHTTTPLTDSVELSATGTLLHKQPSILEIQMPHCWQRPATTPDDAPRRRIGVILTGYTIEPG